MPELPEVETIRRDLAERITGKKIAGVSVRHAKTVRGAPAVFSRRLVGRSVRAIHRVGKLLIFIFDVPDYQLLVHLKMTGQLIYRGQTALVAGGHFLSGAVLELPGRHTRVVISFSDGAELFFNDMRLFGYMHLSDPETVDRVKKTYGIEPLTPDFTLERFQKIVRPRRTSIKAVLLRQNLIAGLGNIYADEACFRAGIRPDRPARGLTPEEIVRLHRACEHVIRLGIKHRGTTFNSFVDADGRSGGFLRLLRVYGRDGERCLGCKTALIKKIRTAGRGTHFCPVCQV
ncbi:MAG: Formamidopyrimidine-DNA glycosylase [Candidatus Magasanikbacteria bacterium GW2011_GWA2_56_11]|uniref:Formamidopyrimidine-DNA glycosylase n=1 Tax=Candidatus Magasanikbacteria bacterium GW2011_GWA2_56_11 TaxID=1619044 RepID=A0A0G2BBU4_9BACT|nr:MAG: Formamidopyrimidine-DNA glycosylase [Candidatus Magasanikbacteria bacterium GW2011_GWA2_56_11]